MKLPVVLPCIPQERLPVTSHTIPSTTSETHGDPNQSTGRTVPSEQLRNSVTPDKHYPDAPRKTSVDPTSSYDANRESSHVSEADIIPQHTQVSPVDTKPEIANYSQIDTPSKFTQASSVSHLVKRPITRKRTKEHSVPSADENYTVTPSVPSVKYRNEKYTVKRPAFSNSPSTSAFNPPVLLIEDSDTVPPKSDTNIIINKKKWAKILPRPSTSIQPAASIVSVAKTTFSNMLLSSSVPNLYGATVMSSESPAYIVTAPQPKSNNTAKSSVRQTSSTVNTDMTASSAQTSSKLNSKTAFHKDVRQTFPNWSVCLDRRGNIKKPIQIIPKPTPDVHIPSPCVLPSVVNNLPSGNDNTTKSSRLKSTKSKQSSVSHIPDNPSASLMAKTHKKTDIPKLPESPHGRSKSRHTKHDSPRAERLKLALKYLDEATEEEERLYFNDALVSNSQIIPTFDSSNNLKNPKELSGKVQHKRQRNRKSQSPRRISKCDRKLSSQNTSSSSITFITQQNVVNTSTTIQSQMNVSNSGVNGQSLVADSPSIGKPNVFLDKNIVTNLNIVTNEHSSVLVPAPQIGNSSADNANTSLRNDLSENTNAVTLGNTTSTDCNAHRLLQENSNVPENVKQLYDNAKELVEQVGLYRMSLIQHHKLFVPAKKPSMVNAIKTEKCNEEQSTSNMKYEKNIEIKDTQIKQVKTEYDTYESMAKLTSDPNHIDVQEKTDSKRNRTQTKPALDIGTKMSGHNTSSENNYSHNVDTSKGKLAQNPVVLLERCITLSTEPKQKPILAKSDNLSSSSEKVLNTGNTKQRPIKCIPTQKQLSGQNNVCLVIGNNDIEKVKQLQQYPKSSENGIQFDTRGYSKARHSGPLASSGNVSSSSQRLGLHLNKNIVTLRILPSNTSVQDKSMPITNIRTTAGENGNSKHKRFDTNENKDISIKSKSKPMGVQSVITNTAIDSLKVKVTPTSASSSLTSSLTPALKESVPVSVSSTMTRQETPKPWSKNPFSNKSIKTVAEMLKEKRSKEHENKCKQVKMPVQLYGMAANRGAANAKDKCSNRKGVQGKTCLTSTQTTNGSHSPAVAACSNDLDHCYIRRTNELYSQIEDSRLLGDATSQATPMRIASNLLTHPSKTEIGLQTHSNEGHTKKIYSSEQQQETSRTAIINAVMLPIGVVASSFNSNALSKKGAGTNGTRSEVKHKHEDIKRERALFGHEQPSTSGCQNIKTESSEKQIHQKKTADRIKNFSNLERDSEAAKSGLKRKKTSQKSNSKHRKITHEQQTHTSETQNRTPFKPLTIVPKADTCKGRKRDKSSIKTFIGALGLKHADKVRKNSRSKGLEQPKMGSIISVAQAGTSGINIKKSARVGGVKSKTMKTVTMTIIKDSKGCCRYNIQLSDIKLIYDLNSMYHRWFENSDFPCTLHFTEDGGIRQIDVESLRKGLFLVTESTNNVHLLSDTLPHSSHALLAPYPGYIAAVPNTSMAIAVGELFQTEETAAFCLQNALCTANDADDILDKLLGYEISESEPDFTDGRYGSITNRNMSPKWHSPSFYTDEMQSYYSQAPEKIDYSSANSLLNTKMLRSQPRTAKMLKTQPRPAVPQGFAGFKLKANAKVPVHCEKAMALKQRQNELFAICRKFQHERETKKIEDSVSVDLDSDDEVIIVDGNSDWEDTSGIPVMNVLPEMVRGVNYLRGNTNNNDVV